MKWELLYLPYRNVASNTIRECETPWGGTCYVETLYQVVVALIREGRVKELCPEPKDLPDHREVCASWVWD